MKKHLVLLLAIICAFSLTAWGPTGHRAVAQIAENHLTEATRLSIKKLLGRETLADVSNYADEIRSDPAFKYTAPYHYINLQSGYTFVQFAEKIKNMTDDNIYRAVLTSERDLKDPGKSNAQKATALKFLVHLIGDLHQPMHVSHAEDKGGNAINVTFNGFNYNLHSLWDGGLIEHEGLSYREMAKAYDKAKPAEIDRLQHDDILVWLWESYQISSILYTEAAENPAFEEPYYQSHLPVLQSRIEKAGIRLAGVLNGIFDATQRP